MAHSLSSAAFTALRRVSLCGRRLDTSEHGHVVRVAQRDAVLDALHSKGIAAGIHYPFPLHLTGAFEGSSPRGAFPVAERLADEILSLPLFPGITAQQQEEVARALIDSLA